jgi:hypothetical protein
MTMINQTTLAEMAAQSRDVITNPSVATFERYEKRGSIGTAGVYILVAAVLAGILGFIPALISAGLGGAFSTLILGVVGALINFVIFTGLVFYLGRNMANGTGSWDEVAYSFALFIAPLAVLGGVLSLIVGLLIWIPVLGALIGLAGFLVGLLILLAQVYFGYLAVQSSMNIHDSTKALIVLVLSAVGAFVAQLILGGIGGALGGILPIIILVALVAFVASMIMRRGGRSFR